MLFPVNVPITHHALALVKFETYVTMIPVLPIGLHETYLGTVVEFADTVVNVFNPVIFVSNPIWLTVPLALRAITAPFAIVPDATN